MACAWAAAAETDHMKHGSTACFVNIQELCMSLVGFEVGQQAALPATAAIPTTGMCFGS
jgi:hypothetical protein